MLSFDTYKTASCEDGDVQLFGGDVQYEGRVEVCFNHRWGTVNSDKWSDRESQVVCRQLGYATKGTYYIFLLHIL